MASSFIKKATGRDVPVDDTDNPLPVTLAGAGSSTVATNITQAGSVTLESTSTTAGGIPVYILDPATGLRAAIATVVQVNTEGQKATYSATAVAVTAAASATDIFTLTGSATKTIRVTKFGVSGIATAVGTQQINIIKRSTANTSGTSANLTEVSHDSTSGVATATALSYTANPTLGTAVGTIRSTALPLGAAAAVGGGEKEWVFGDANDQTIVLRGVAEVLALNLNASIVTGAIITAWVEWTEE